MTRLSRHCATCRSGASAGAWKSYTPKIPRRTADGRTVIRSASPRDTQAPPTCRAHRTACDQRQSRRAGLRHPGEAAGEGVAWPAMRFRMISRRPRTACGRRSETVPHTTCRSGGGGLRRPIGLVGRAYRAGPGIDYSPTGPFHRSVPVLPHNPRLTRRSPSGLLHQKPGLPHVGAQCRHRRQRPDCPPQPPAERLNAHRPDRFLESDRPINDKGKHSSPRATPAARTARHCSRHWSGTVWTSARSHSNRNAAPTPSSTTCRPTCRPPAPSAASSTTAQANQSISSASGSTATTRM